MLPFLGLKALKAILKNAFSVILRGEADCWGQQLCMCVCCCLTSKVMLGRYNCVCKTEIRSAFCSPKRDCFCLQSCAYANL